MAAPANSNTRQDVHQHGTAQQHAFAQRDHHLGTHLGIGLIAHAEAAWLRGKQL
jgi:hypothetical protein